MTEDKKVIKPFCVHILDEELTDPQIENMFEALLKLGVEQETQVEEVIADKTFYPYFGVNNDNETFSFDTAYCSSFKNNIIKFSEVEEFLGLTETPSEAPTHSAQEVLQQAEGDCISKDVAAPQALTGSLLSDSCSTESPSEDAIKAAFKTAQQKEMVTLSKLQTLLPDEVDVRVYSTGFIVTGHYEDDYEVESEEDLIKVVECINFLDKFSV